MALLRKIGGGLRVLFQKTQVEREMDEELNDYLDAAMKDKMRLGMNRKEALRAARVEMGSVDAVKEGIRTVGWESTLESLRQDIRCGLRQLRRNPGFTVVAVLTLALGIGANTAVFSVVDALILRNLPVHDPSRLVGFYTVNTGGQWSGITVPQIQEINREQKVFEGVFGRRYPNHSNVEEHGVIWPINLGYITGSYYSVLGVKPAVGRLISPDDVGLSRGAPSPVAVISYDFWQRRYAGAQQAIGKTILIAGEPFTIIGVTAKGFFGEQVGFSLDVTIPITRVPGQVEKSGRAFEFEIPGCQYAVGRLRDGVSIEQAKAQLGTIWPAVRAATVPPDLNPQQRDEYLAKNLRVDPYPTNGFSYLRDQFAKPLYVLMGISCLIILIASVNLATLLLARAWARQHEMGIRIALGAGRWRLMRQQLTESLLLSISGAALGLGFASWGSRWLVGFWSHIAFNPPTVIDVSPDIRVLGFATAIAILAAILFGLAPAWYASRGAPTGALQEASYASGRNIRRFGKLLIVIEVALSIPLVTTGGLLVRSLERLRTASPGFDYHQLVVLQLESDTGNKKSLDDAYYHALVQQLSEIPSVRSVALSQMLPGSGFGGSDTVGPSGSGTGVDADSQIVSPDFFQTVRIAFVRGRDFTWEDNGQAPRVSLVSESLAKQLFPSGDPIGQRINIGTDPKRRRIEVVGVVNDARVRDIRKPSPFIVYVPFLQEAEYIGYWTNVEMLAADRPSTVLEAARQRIDSLGRQYVFYSETLEGTINTTVSNERALAFVSGFFAALALLLAGVGLFGLMSYTVSQRTRELGIRIALGARNRGVLWMILRDSLGLVLIGEVIGFPCALAATRLVAHMLLDISPYDPATLATVAGAVVTIGIVSGYFPARRATKVDPMVALRYE
ncbi:MAG TPA: ABC transporter permease [Terriglobia bacterium]|nr:ABC transporter permease [Terriglobia bacterium]